MTENACGFRCFVCGRGKRCGRREAESGGMAVYGVAGDGVNACRMGKGGKSLSGKGKVVLFTDLSTENGDKAVSDAGWRERWPGADAGRSGRRKVWEVSPFRRMWGRCAGYGALAS